jgi:hypothetical protein
MAFLLIGASGCSTHLPEKLLPDIAMSTRPDACGTYILSCPDLIRAFINLRKGVFELDGLPGQARQ